MYLLDTNVLSHAMRRRPPTRARIQEEILGRVDVLGVSLDEAVVAGDTMAHLWARGQVIDVEDVLIGATAVARNLTVVTNNVDHFRRVPRLHVEDWTAGV